MEKEEGARRAREGSLGAGRGSRKVGRKDKDGQEKAGAGGTRQWGGGAEENGVGEWVGRGCSTLGRAPWPPALPRPDNLPMKGMKRPGPLARGHGAL